MKVNFVFRKTGKIPNGMILTSDLKLKWANVPDLEFEIRFPTSARNRGPRLKKRQELSNNDSQGRQALHHLRDWHNTHV